LPSRDWRFIHYLEEGKIAGAGQPETSELRIAMREEEVRCFSGEFSDCAFLVGPAVRRTLRNRLPKPSAIAFPLDNRSNRFEFRIDGI